MINILIFYILPIILVVIAFLRYKFAFWKSHGFDSTQPWTPLGDFGDVGFRYHFAEKFAKLYAETEKKTKFFGAYAGLSPTLIVNDLDMLRLILVKDFHNFQDRSVYFNEEVDPLSAHLFSIEGEKWRRMRNNLSPTFTSGKMKQMFHTISDKGQDLIKFINDNYAKTGEVVNVKEVTQRFTAEAIGSCAFGLECNALKSTKEPEILNIAKEVFESTPFTAFYFFFISTCQRIAKFFKCRVFKKSVEDYFMPMIESTAKHREANNVRRSDFFNMLLNLKNHGTIYDDKDGNPSDKINFNELCAQAFIFFFAGFETSSTAMSYALYFIAKNPEIQQKVRDEVRSVKKSHNDEINYDALMEMHYLNQVFNETLRMYPPVGNLIRYCQNDYKVPDTDLIIPKGIMVNIPVFGIHYNPEIYPNPEKFDPDRFSPEEVQKRHPYAFLPFGEGPRNCIGMRFAQLQSKFGLATIIDNFEITVNKKTQEPLKLDLSTPNMAVKGGLWLNAKALK
ncbi:cytochrome P450 6A1-like [Culicoides brevitarsis]|uniref:cytochrome P450 6A1-like n=1 Tax=Culicoides brevitarsis TaxID=469753 RepID=UPI00307CA009